MATKRVQWKCPNGHTGVLGPSKPRRDNICRYCLQCSAKTGKLVERVAPALEAKRQTKAQAAKERAKAKTVAAKAREDAKWIVEGVDLRKALKAAMKLPTCNLRHEPTLVVTRSKTKSYASGRAWISRRKITMVVGETAKASNAVGTLLHEIAHHVCYYNGENYNDGSRQFARRCHDLHDEWNAKKPLGVTVLHELSGAYRGTRAKVDWSHPDHGKRIEAPDARLARLTAGFKNGGLKWQDHFKPGTKLDVPPSVWTEFQCISLDCASDENERQWMVGWCDENTKRNGRGTVTLTLPDEPARCIEMLDEMEDAVGFHYEPQVALAWCKMWGRVALKKEQD